MIGSGVPPKHDKRQYPLRKVIERDILIEERAYPAPNIYGNRLECGHVVRPAKDFYGEIFSVKQRCRYCHEEKMGGI
jgi:hypothetical protein